MYKSKKLFVDTSLVVDDPSTSNINDKLRLSLNQVWKFNQDNGSLNYSPNLKIMDNIPYSVEYGKTNYDQRHVFLEQDQEVRVTGKPIFNFLEFDGEKWENQINRTFPKTEDYIHEDHVFEADMLYSGKELEKLNGAGFNPPFVKIQTEYNFFIRQYEELITNINVPEALMPNLYAFASEKRYPRGKDEDPSDFHEFITLAGALPSDMVNPRSLDLSNKKEEHKDKTNQYFDLWTRRFFLADKDKTRVLKEKYSNLFFSHEDLALMKDHASDIRNFPMAIRIEFSTDKSSAFSEILRETNLFDSFMYDVVDHFDSLEEAKREAKSGLIDSILSLPTTVKKFTLFQDGLDFTDTGYKRRSREAYNTETFVMDLTDWWQSLGNFFINQQDDDERFQDLRNKATQKTSKSTTSGIDVSLRPEPRQPAILKKRKLNRSVYFGKKSPMLIGREPGDDFVRNLMLMIFNGKVRNLIFDKMRTYEEISNGKTAYTETVFYKISKHLIVDGTAEARPAQNFFIPNSKDYDVLDFIDTQVKYGERYSYKYIIKAYNLVVGTKYKFLEPNFPNGEYKSDVVVKSRPSLQIVEVPIHEREVAVLDDAPMHPNVNVIPFRGISNKIKFNLEGNVGSYMANPILIQGNKDFNWAFNFRKKRGLSQQEMITYNSDDNYGHFEIFKIEDEPTSYVDFSDSRIEQISNNLIAGQTSQAASAASFEDTIEPNKKYYYTFRSIDAHGNISNPTPIYEVQLLDDNGSVIPKIRIMNLTGEPQKIEFREPALPLRQYLKIEPAFQHVNLNMEASKLPEPGEPLGSYNLKNVILGFADESIWGKTFKIRITSKSTGKKVDLNLTFKTTAIKKGDF